MWPKGGKVPRQPPGSRLETMEFLVPRLECGTFENSLRQNESLGACFQCPAHPTRTLHVCRMDSFAPWRSFPCSKISESRSRDSLHKGAQFPPQCAIRRL